MIGRDAANAEVFRVNNNGNVQVQGISLTSDRNAKKNFSSINSLAILEKVARLPISSWTYKTDTNNLRHIGPMAQDFHKIFGLNGKDDKHISSIDEQGVALAAIQGLYQQNQKLTAQLKSLEARFAKLEQK
jgi:Chaperone of endosialidase